MTFSPAGDPNELSPADVGGGEAGGGRAELVGRLPRADPGRSGVREPAAPDRPQIPRGFFRSERRTSLSFSLPCGDFAVPPLY